MSSGIGPTDLLPQPNPSAVATAAAPTERLNTKAAGIIGLAVMCSRVLGLIREQICAGLFGGGGAMDAFTAAFRIPNLLRLRTCNASIVLSQVISRFPSPWSGKVSLLERYASDVSYQTRHTV